MFLKTFDPRGLSAPALRAINMYMTPIFKDLFPKTAWPIKAKLYVEPPWEGGKKVYINYSGHITKMAAMPIYGKNLLKSFFLQN